MAYHKTMSDEQKIEQLLSEQQYMVLAVALEDGRPWVVPVRIKSRSGNKFEWDSVLTTEHSKALAVNPDMAITVFQKKDDSQVGLYAQGMARLVEEFKPGIGHYMFEAEKCWINDESFVKREINLG